VFEKHKQRKLRDEQLREYVAQLRQLVARLPDGSGLITADGFKEFINFVSQHDIDLNAVPDVRREVRLGLAQGGLFLETQTSLMLRKDEVPVLDVGVNLLKEVTDRQFRGGSQGVSIPIGLGVRYRVGEFRGHTVTTGHHWETADEGQLTVTNQRIVFRGARKTLEFPFPKLATLNAYSDAVALGVTSRQATSTFATGDSILIVGLIHAAIAHQSDATIMRLSYG
jgi:hypothetical protein